MHFYINLFFKRHIYSTSSYKKNYIKLTVLRTFVTRSIMYDYVVVSHIRSYEFTHILHSFCLGFFSYVFFLRRVRSVIIYTSVYLIKKKKHFFKILFYYTIFVFSLSLSSVYSRNHYYIDFEYYVNGVLC